MITEVRVVWYMKWFNSDTERLSGFVNDIVKQQTSLHVNLKLESV